MNSHSTKTEQPSFLTRLHNMTMGKLRGASQELDGGDEQMQGGYYTSDDEDWEGGSDELVGGARRKISPKLEAFNKAYNSKLKASLMKKHPRSSPKEIFRMAQKSFFKKSGGKAKKRSTTKKGKKRSTTKKAKKGKKASLKRK